MTLAAAIWLFPGCKILIQSPTSFIARKGNDCSHANMSKGIINVVGSLRPIQHPIEDEFLIPLLDMMNPCPCCCLAQINQSDKGFWFGVISVQDGIAMVASGHELQRCSINAFLKYEVIAFMKSGEGNLCVLEGLTTHNLNLQLVDVVGQQGDRLLVNLGSKQIAVHPSKCVPLQKWLASCMTYPTWPSSKPMRIPEGLVQIIRGEYDGSLGMILSRSVSGSHLRLMIASYPYSVEVETRDIIEFSYSFPRVLLEFS